MSLSPLQALAITSTLLLLLGLISGWIKNRLWLSEPAVALCVGTAMAPFLTHLTVPGALLHEPLPVLMEVARVTVSISVMSAALRLPAAYVVRDGVELVLVLSVGMGAMWLLSTGVVLSLLDVTLLVALVIGAAVTPTDPVLAHSIVSSKLAQRALPSRLRQTLTAESGANDGLGLPVLMLPVLLLLHPPQQAVTDWLIFVLAKEVLGGLALGLVVGLASGLLLRWYCRQPFREDTSVLTLSIALALTVLTVGRMVGVDGILGVFVSGLVLKRFICSDDDQASEQTEAAVDRFFNIPIFVLFGALLPWQEWQALGWPGLAAAAGLLVLRRLPAWLLLAPALPSLQAGRDRLFNGWFGPIGIAALFYGIHAREQTGDETIWAMVSLTVFVSALAHGVTATPLTRLYARRAGG